MVDEIVNTRGFLFFLKLRLFKLVLSFRVGNGGFGFSGTFPTSLGAVKANAPWARRCLVEMPLAVEVAPDVIFPILACELLWRTTLVEGMLGVRGLCAVEPVVDSFRGILVATRIGDED